ncbi:MAG: hypothetical protein AAFY26_13890 [Cyanobacteria bacterium J06638_22]
MAEYGCPAGWIGGIANPCTGVSAGIDPELSEPSRAIAFKGVRDSAG